MTTLETFLSNYARECLRPPPRMTVSEWCERNLFIPAPQIQVEGYIRFDGREYCREFIDDFNNPRITDEVACFGSQTGKTTALMAGVAWSITNDPCGVIWVMPGMDLARSFAETRWIPVLRSSPELSRLIPTGKDRHSFKTAQQQIGSAVINFVGSNSPANLASRPARRIILDEVDKFSEGGTNGEADAVNLAEQRTKSFANPQRFKTSTPSLMNGLIWTEFLKGDQRRYFVPCPHCEKSVLLAWSKEYTVFKLTGNEAFVVWDKEARRPDGSWDLERVERSAHAVCPHCEGRILDGHKTKMVRGGEWRPTSDAPTSFRSRHLPSLYASAPETSFGRLAVKFLQAKKSLLGLQGFINGDLAEPYASQDTSRQRTEIVTKLEKSESSGWARLMTVDCQQNAPHFWWIVRAWRAGNSEGIASGYADSWETIRELQLKHQVKDEAVLIDSGFGAKSDAEVYANCARFCSARGRILLGWMPAKGMPSKRRWKDTELGIMVPWNIESIDPYDGTSQAGQFEMSLFEFSGEFFKDVLAMMRDGKTENRWNVLDTCASEEYWRHIDSEVKAERINMRTGRSEIEWVKRSHRWPNHLLDCEVMQVALASFLQLLKLT